jgi:hypothetical protein
MEHLMLRGIKEMCNGYLKKLNTLEFDHMTDEQFLKIEKMFRFYRFVFRLNSFKSQQVGDIETFAKQFILTTRDN